MNTYLNSRKSFVPEWWADAWFLVCTKTIKKDHFALSVETCEKLLSYFAYV